MKLDPQLVQQHFELVNGKLFRKLVTGALKPIVLVDRGRLMSTLKGRRVFGPELAWTLRYGVSPIWPAFTLSADYTDFSEHNLICSRLKRIRYTPTRRAVGWRHHLSRQLYLTEPMCRADWCRYALSYYNRDNAFVVAAHLALVPLQQSDQESYRRNAKKERAPVIKPPKVLLAPDPVEEKDARPPEVPGRLWRWYKNVWVSIPEPCHPSDDWVIRSEAVLKRPTARFIYDSGAEVTAEI